MLNIIDILKKSNAAVLPWDLTPLVGFVRPKKNGNTVFGVVANNVFISGITYGVSALLANDTEFGSVKIGTITDNSPFWFAFKSGTHPSDMAGVVHELGFFNSDGSSPAATITDINNVLSVMNASFQSTVLDASFMPGDVVVVAVNYPNAGDLSFITATYGYMPSVLTGVNYTGKDIVGLMEGAFGPSGGTLTSQLFSDVNLLPDALKAVVNAQEGLPPLMSTADADLPQKAKEGTVLDVTVSGSWGGKAYTAGKDGAVVVSLNPPTVLPFGNTTGEFSAGAKTPSYVPMFTADVGDGKTFAAMTVLNAFLLANGISGKSLIINLYDTAGSSSVDIYFPMFESITVAPNGIVGAGGSCDLNHNTLNITGGKDRVDVYGHITTTAPVNMVGVNLGVAVINCQLVVLKNWTSTNATINITEHGNSCSIGDAVEIYGPTISYNELTVNTTATLDSQPGLNVGGRLGAVIFNSNMPITLTDVMSRMFKFYYSGGDLPSLMGVVGVHGGNVYIDTIVTGTANADYAITIDEAAFVGTPLSSVNSYGTIANLYNVTPNTPSRFGYLMVS